MDRYPDPDDYVASKWKIFAHQDETDVAILGSSLAPYAEQISQLRAKVFFIRQSHETPPANGVHIKKDRMVFYMENQQIYGELPINKIPLKGRHNLENIAASALAALTMGTPFPDIAQTVHKFIGLPHRMEYVTTVDDIAYYNDSKATNPDAVIKALSCFDNLILIMGGREKNTDFSLLKKSIQSRVKHLILMGDAADKIQKSMMGICETSLVDTMAAAVKKARTLARKGDTVMLSPACASFDMYESYGHRGDDFKNQVKQLKKT